MAKSAPTTPVKGVTKNKVNRSSSKTQPTFMTANKGKKAPNLTGKGKM